jgi:hypothetical protein
MKSFRNLFTLLVFCALGMTTSAQSGFGIRAGVNIANQSFEGGGFSIKPDSKVGFDVAILYNAAFPGGFAIQPEVHFAQAGFKLDLGTIGSGDAELNYIQIPILFKYDLLSANDNLALSPFVGPYVSVGVSGKQGDIDIEFDGDYKRLDYGAVLGAMIRFTPGFFIDARYNIGLANVSDAQDVDDVKIKNEILGFGVGFIF